MASNTPYIMPGGPGVRSLAQAMKAEREKDDVPRKKKGASTKRGKDLQFMQVMAQKQRLQGTSAEVESSELRALEMVGVRRRRRWLNDKILRDLAGPLTAQDMHDQFNPAPFGVKVPSALEIITRPEHADLWDNFRNIDPEKEAKVLQVGLWPCTMWHTGTTPDLHAYNL